MAVTYTCPNPDCRAALKTATPVAPGKRVKCPKCNQAFTPVPEEEAAPAAGGTFKFADDPPPKPKAPNPAAFNFAADPKAKPAAPKPEPAKPEPPPPAARHDDDDEDDESIKRGYGVVKEEENEDAKVAFGEVQDKYKKSARGPAMAMLVMPSNLLTAAGLLTGIAGLGLFVVSMWPLVFNDAPASDEEIEEAIVGMFLGFLTFGWGGFVCFGASQMQELASYLWAMAGAVMAVPLLVGIYAIVVLQDPKVKAGFEETEGGPEDEDEDEDEEKEDDEDDEDEDEKPKKGAKAKRR